ncbi:MAG: ExeA family protein [Terracidiphilus sp.]
MILLHSDPREQPFGVTPDPRYLYASATHKEALASILYAIESGLGFVALIAKPGMGKTTLLFEVLRRIGKTTKTVFLFQTISTPEDLLRALLIDVGIENVKGSLPEMQAQLNEVLVAESALGKRLVVAIDEAQNLSESVLEAVRMLSNFETPRHKLIQIILSGQPQLEKTLASRQVLQLRQRISIFAHLEPLSERETRAYIQRRLEVSGNQSIEEVFSEQALALIARHGGGIPRNINNLCFNALSLGCALKQRKIDSKVIEEVLADLRFREFDSHQVLQREDSRKAAHAGKNRRMPRTAKRRVGVRSIVWAAFVIALILMWPSFADDRLASANNSVQASSSATSSSMITPAAATSQSDAVLPSHTLNTTLHPKISMVQIHEGQSLYKLCAEAFGGCRQEDLREMLKMNPTIRDPNRIPSGQWISILVSPPDSVRKR